jgi:hypothetical protein
MIIKDRNGTKTVQGCVHTPMTAARVNNERKKEEREERKKEKKIHTNHRDAEK